ncbi:cytochrome c oxidase subunit II [Nitrosococcus wardiae]|uniref:Cytochrome c oxidase subunit 2 n=1 Tax=Nitrosococcus wardiae TaxID=1814290 RepID=A0A4P7BXA0_9GAMM|nr:cytochrome c oxidase subunit II [Nitrosococcus wardiae]QBQ53730.1 cytochrome c oxidase subunit II [Nitrosococcus wardiae]
MGVSDKRSLFTVIAGAIGLFLIGGNANAELAVNLTEGITPSSKEIYGLHMLIFWVCVGIGLLVYGVMAWSIYHHRKSKGVVASQFHENTTLEIVWTVIPFVILLSIAVPATSAMIRLYDASDSELTIKVTGYQWRWRYDYVDHGFGFMSNLSTPFDQIANKSPKGENYLLEVDNPLVLPINKKVRFVITADDVIHAWWVPALGFKQDAVPGFINEAWAVIEEPGTYRGQCTELCGRGHGYMPIVVEAKTQEEFDKWVSSQKAAQPNDTNGDSTESSS